jgi:hypothetical protein
MVGAFCDVPALTELPGRSGPDDATAQGLPGGSLMPYEFARSKLPSGRSYPLKRSALDAALLAAGVVDEVHRVYYNVSTMPVAEVIRANYTGELRSGFFAAGKSSVTLLAVESTRRPAVEAELTRAGLPVLVTWLARLRRAGNVIRGIDQQLVLTVDERGLHVEGSERSLWA